MAEVENQKCVAVPNFDVEPISEGYQYFLWEDYKNAVPLLAQECNLLVKEHGERAGELIRIYMLYGEALLKLWRKEQFIAEYLERNGQKEVMKDDEKKVLGKEFEKLTTGEGPASTRAQTEGRLQEAWKYVKLAEEIFTKHKDHDKKFCARIHKLLGEIALEMGNKDAITLLSDSLEVLIKVMKPDSFFIADINYRLGMAYLLNNNFKESFNSLQKAEIIYAKKLNKYSQYQTNVWCNQTEFTKKMYIQVEEGLEKASDMWRQAHPEAYQ